MLHSTWIGECLKPFPDIIRNFIKEALWWASSSLSLNLALRTAVLSVLRFPCYKTLSLKDSTRNPNTIQKLNLQDQGIGQHRLPSRLVARTYF